jgi:hypothetical protein
MSYWVIQLPNSLSHPGPRDKICTQPQKFCSTSDKVYQLLAHGRWFSPTSSTTKTGRCDIAEILLKVALNTKKIKSNLSMNLRNV